MDKETLLWVLDTFVESVFASDTLGRFVSSFSDDLAVKLYNNGITMDDLNPMMMDLMQLQDDYGNRFDLLNIVREGVVCSACGKRHKEAKEYFERKTSCPYCKKEKGE